MHGNLYVSTVCTDILWILLFFFHELIDCVVFSVLVTGTVLTKLSFGDK